MVSHLLGRCWCANTWVELDSVAGAQSDLEFSYKGVLDSLRELYFKIVFILILQETFIQVILHEYHKIE